MKKLRIFLKKMQADRKGAAMEMAIMMLVVAFTLSTLVLTTSLLQHTRHLRAEKAMEKSIVLEQIGADFCTAVTGGVTEHTWVARYPDHSIQVNSDAETQIHKLTVTEQGSETVLLTVELTKTGEQYTITQWNKN